MSGFNGTRPPPVEDEKTQRWLDHITDRIDRIGRILCPDEYGMQYPQRMARLETRVWMLMVGVGGLATGLLGWIFS